MFVNENVRLSLVELIVNLHHPLAIDRVGTVDVIEKYVDFLLCEIHGRPSLFGS